MKPNEALSKEKPRAIISAGDDGVVCHIFDAGILEHVLFENPVFEQRSIKHASPREVARRAGEFLRNYDFVASMDFGAFDGSCTSEVRNLIENDIIVSLFSKLLDVSSLTTTKDVCFPPFLTGSKTRGTYPSSQC